MKKAAIINRYPAAPETDYFDEIQRLNHQANRCVVILDDDPTGNQTVYDVPVFTTWSKETIVQAFNKNTPVFFILTNSRSLTEKDAMALGKEIATNLINASRETNRHFIVISRSDSTLRGHYPSEVRAMEDILFPQGAVHCLIPAFFQGGRFTINGIHYVKENDDLIPASETPFARDDAFGFNHAELNKWVEEKTGGLVNASDVFSIDLELLRSGGPEKVKEVLLKKFSASDSSSLKVCTVDALEQSDLNVFCYAALKAERQGVRFLYRTAASFINSYVGIKPGLPLKNIDMPKDSGNGALYIAGSHVPKTTKQIENLIEKTDIIPLEINVQELVHEDQGNSFREKIVERMNNLLSQGNNLLLYTSRNVLKGKDMEEGLNIGQKISAGLVRILNDLEIRPKYILAKGGITSSDLATRGLNVISATVTGQILPGVPVWRLGEETKYPGLSFIIFPGNVGSVSALVNVYEKLEK